MDVVSVCPLPVGSVVWQPSLSVWVLTVVCKATFSLRPGEVILANEQEAPNEEDDHWNDDAGRSPPAYCRAVVTTSNLALIASRKIAAI